MSFDFEKWLKGPEPAPTEFQVHPGYDDLPVPIKELYTAEEYTWLSNQDRESLIERECTPEAEED